MSNSGLRWRKFSPIDREYPIYELVDGDVVILDVANSAGQSLEIAFHEEACRRVFDLLMIEQLIAEVRLLVANDEPI